MILLDNLFPSTDLINTGHTFGVLAISLMVDFQILLPRYLFNTCG
ncbi:hypothetical protein M097_3012 [Phocaeicola vulgatus str. 3775 SL(B) 10 (iv)]|uniref:Uncharacterized protein n=1 Tax=Phocaeicola vulgatus str. 3775 SL(B) 10 (iv) TaxID=1339350 RepID=A0A078R3F2_PHOVU|nr:hypothetical protein M097_3012 [Phocaeicola vulgatus str. 3775 SL(B) 10 (iv)]